ncbi:MAG: hypothetical protein JXA18_01660 [Chitinispirillaceae bacterium]|nr:hypothetical protein [Chitinispirillaceae bacterium]
MKCRTETEQGHAAEAAEEWGAVLRQDREEAVYARNAGMSNRISRESLALRGRAPVAGRR